MLLARLELARGDAAAAAAILAKAEQFVREHNFARHLLEVAALQVRTLLCQGRLVEAFELAEKHPLPTGRARVCLAREDPGSALAALEPLRRQVEAKGWESERLQVMVLQALALYVRARNAHSTVDKAVYLLGDALALAEPGGMLRVFLDEGPPMAQLLHTAATRDIVARGIATRGNAGRGSVAEYAGRLLAAFSAAEPEPPVPPQEQAPVSELIEPLSERELEVLQLIAEGLTNPEIAARLFLALNTVKVHTRNIYGKLGVHTRTQAIARARALGVLSS